jgi:hypothetical protein
MLDSCWVRCCRLCCLCQRLLRSWKQMLGNLKSMDGECWRMALLRCSSLPRLEAAPPRALERQVLRRKPQQLGQQERLKEVRPSRTGSVTELCAAGDHADNVEISPNTSFRLALDERRLLRLALHERRLLRLVNVTLAWEQKRHLWKPKRVEAIFHFITMKHLRPFVIPQSVISTKIT